MMKGRFLSLLAFLLVLLSCERDGFDLSLNVGPFNGETRKVMLLYGAGYNSLSEDIRDNIDTLKQGWLPGNGRSDDVFLVFSHLTSQYHNYKRETAPVLYRLYKSRGDVVMDTLKVWPAGTVVADPAMVHEVFTWVKEEFPAAGYGAVFSSHATGWLPEGYFSDPARYEGKDRGSSGFVWGAPPKRTFGQEYYPGGEKTKEIELHDLAAAIPYHLDYILFDACFMATVEVAWALKDVTSYVAFSPCEIPAAGLDYRSMTRYLLSSDTPDLKAVCEDYYARYKDDTTYGAAVTMVDCSALDGLAEACRPLFERYRSAIRELDGRQVQVYDRENLHKGYLIFFDLKDLLREAGATEAELAGLQKALDAALVYEAHTDKFINVQLERCCGLSMYLPAYPDYRSDKWHGTAFLDGFYREHIAWNQATSLVD